MNKICGYNCEHNKGSQCQITYCDKIGEITTTTQWLSGGRQQGKTYQLIKDQQKEIERLNNIINETIKDIEHSALWLGDKQVELKNTPFGKRILEKLKEDK